MSFKISPIKLDTYGVNSQFYQCYFVKNKNIRLDDVAASLEVCAEQEAILRTKLLRWSK